VQRNYKKLAAVLVLVLVALALCAPVASAVGSDRDADGIRNASDHCPKNYNPDQKDLDGDGKGDVCDSDRDGDGQLNADDPCPDDALNGCVAPPPPPPPGDPVFVGAGDIASCASSGDEATANLLDGIPGTVYTLGDNAYDSGTSAEFANCYNPSWGRHIARTKPSVGNHEYQTAGASGYYNYFGDAASPTDPPGCRVNCKGYYSYNLGAWHIIALNSMCENVGGCGASSTMVTWLKGDLAANPSSSSCTLAYWHHPVFSSGSAHGNNPKMIPSWDALDAAGADVVLSGHDHDYERFAPQTSSGVAPPAGGGIREFVVGTGGRSLRAFGTIRANSEVRNSDTYGVLKLTLHASSYDWQFVPEAGKTFSDSGTGNCH
jgi:acid phosphatase type 7